MTATPTTTPTLLERAREAYAAEIAAAEIAWRKRQQREAEEQRDARQMAAQNWLALNNIESAEMTPDGYIMLGEGYLGWACMSGYHDVRLIVLRPCPSCGGLVNGKSMGVETLAGVASQVAMFEPGRGHIEQPGPQCTYEDEEGDPITPPQKLTRGEMGGTLLSHMEIGRQMWERTGQYTLPDFAPDAPLDRATLYLTGFIAGAALGNEPTDREPVASPDYAVTAERMRLFHEFDQWLTSRGRL